MKESNFSQMKHLLYPLISLLFWVATIHSSHAQERIPPYFDSAMDWDEQIPTPAEHFGWEPGTWHLTPYQIADYLSTIAEKSDRAVMFEYARRAEGPHAARWVEGGYERARVAFLGKIVL